MLKIKTLSYHNPNHARILEACLRKWFQNPKDLNLTSPNMRYPFRFSQWKQKNYPDSQALTCVVENDDWIIGHGSLKLYPDEKRGHIFHLFIAAEARRQGYARKLTLHLIDLAIEQKFEKVTLFVSPNNDSARKLYGQLGFTVVENRKQKSVAMEKYLDRS